MTVTVPENRLEDLCGVNKSEKLRYESMGKTWGVGDGAFGQCRRIISRIIVRNIGNIKAKSIPS
tara:strand:+ start:946 stop:1137 length:192 start_codon:yes stop_codon:yes gene_type:complete